MRSWFIGACAVLILCAQFALPARAADDSAASPYAKFIEGAQAQRGLFTVWRKGDKVYLELSKEQLGKDYIQSAVPVNGLGGFGIYPGAFDYFSARLIRFTRNDDKIVITWPNTTFTAPAGSPADNAIKATSADSVLGVSKVAADDPLTGNVVFDASPFLGDVIDLSDTLKFTLNTNPEQQYRLNPEQSMFGPSKAFPKNVLIEAQQSWETTDPVIVDNVPDPRSIRFRVDYNIMEPPDTHDYMPRIADDRVGFFSNGYLDFGNDRKRNRQLYYVIRWNMQPSDPSKTMSPATHPMVFYLSNTIPTEYRSGIRDALLNWNDAFRRIGISDAIQVKDQPTNDPTWDPDDIRYNVVRWLTESNGGGFAEAQIVADPRTGEEFHTGILVDADIVQGGNFEYNYLVDPTRAPSRSFAGREAEYAAGMRDQGQYGIVALQLMGVLKSYQAPSKYYYDFMKSIILHEAGHDMGLQHNYIGSEAYTAKQLQSKSFTARYGVATSVMEYAPLNLWPKGTSNGAFFQPTLGPYDYYAIHWGYARIPGARTPEDELPTLRRWAQAWSNPMYGFASDEDAAWPSAHAIDPRVNQWDLSSDTLGWCSTQMNIAHTLFNTLDHKFPRPGEDYESERQAFGVVTRAYGRCALITEHFIGGQYLSRAHYGDPSSSAPLRPVSRNDERRAWQTLDRYLFSDNAWHFSPTTLSRLTYSEYSPFNQASWNYNPPARHDVPIVDLIGTLQDAALDRMFQPLMLQRLRDLALTARPGETMSLSDLFDWTQSSVYGDLTSRNLRTIPLIQRNLQQSYARLLIRLVNAPPAGTPYDAQALARAKLVSLGGDLQRAQRNQLDELTRAHLADLQHRISQGLDARTMVAAPRMTGE